MTIKEVLTLAANMLGEDEVVKLNEDKAVENVDYATQTLNLLKECYDVVTDELATEYCPVLASEDFNVSNKKILFSNFTKQPVKIICVKDEFNNKLAYKLINDYIQINSNGKITVEYHYRPAVCNFNDNALFANYVIGPYVLCYGILAEFCLQKGRLGECATWQDKYMKGIRGKTAKKGSYVMPARRWY
ncbi:MAG: hypothetical protein IJW13_00845 [Clostridia bacterium]|nr:hypothetical protein [Clostridia bacterium]